MANLTGRELYKYDWRAEVFLKKYKAKEAFKLTSGKNVVFIPDESVVKLVQAKMSTARVKLIDETGKNYHFSDIEKTEEFGGRLGENSPLAKENKALESLQKQLEAAKVVQASPSVWIVMGKKTYDVAAVASTPGTLKSDFHFLNSRGEEVAWISHKAGKKATDFQQWGGVSKRLSPSIHNHRETQKFISDLQQEFPGGLPRRTCVFRKIGDPILKLKAIYGQKYHSTGRFGRDNVTALVQGDPVLRRNTINTYKISSHAVHYNGDISVENRPGYEPVFKAFAKADVEYDPVFMALYKGDRSDMGLPGTRVVIAPKGGQGRRPIEFLPN